MWQISRMECGKYLGCNVVKIYIEMWQRSILKCGKDLGSNVANI